MAFREVTSLDADVIVALGKTNKTTGKAYPKQAEGYYLGKRSVQNKRGESNIHFLQTATGNLGVWGTTDLDRKLGQVTAGTMIKITSNGTKATPNGDMYIYKVEVDEANTIEVNVSADTYESADDSDADADTDADEANGVDEDAEQAVALAAAERQARVAALLKGSKRKTN